MAEVILELSDLMLEMSSGVGLGIWRSELRSRMSFLISGQKWGLWFLRKPRGINEELAWRTESVNADIAASRVG